MQSQWAVVQQIKASCMNSDLSSTYDGSDDMFYFYMYSSTIYARRRMAKLFN